MRHVTRAMCVLAVAVLLVTAVSGCDAMKALIPGAASNKIGEEIPGKLVTVRVNKVDVLDEVTGFNALPGPKDEAAWVFVDVTLKNVSGKELPAPLGDSFSVRLETSDDQAAQNAPVLSEGSPTQGAFAALVTKPMATGASATGKLGFYAPLGATLSRISLRGLNGEDDLIAVDLAGAKVTPAAAAKPVRIHSLLEAGGLGVTVNSVRRTAKYTSKSGYWTYTLTPKPGAIFFELDMTLRNRSFPGKYDFKKENIATADFLIRDSDGELWAPASPLTGVGAEQCMPKPTWWAIKPIAKGKAGRGKIVFGVPKKSKGLELIVRVPYFGPTPSIQITD